MLPLLHTPKRPLPASSYICLSCRLQSLRTQAQASDPLEPPKRQGDEPEQSLKEALLQKPRRFRVRPRWVKCDDSKTSGTEKDGQKASPDSNPFVDFADSPEVVVSARQDYGIAKGRRRFRTIEHAHFHSETHRKHSDRRNAAMLENERHNKFINVSPARSRLGGWIGPADTAGPNQDEKVRWVLGRGKGQTEGMAQVKSESSLNTIKYYDSSYTTRRYAAQALREHPFYPGDHNERASAIATNKILANGVENESRMDAPVALFNPLHSSSTTERHVSSKLDDNLEAILDAHRAFASENSDRRRQPTSVTSYNSLKPHLTSKGTQLRMFHSSRTIHQEATAAAYEDTDPSPPMRWITSTRASKLPIRAQLREWQDINGSKEDLTSKLDLDDNSMSHDTPNNFSRLPSLQSSLPQKDTEQEEEREAFAHYMRSSAKDADASVINPKQLNIGDLVEIEFPASERESIIAVFVRYVAMGQYGQFFTMQGRWVHGSTRHVQYSISKWMSPEMLEPLLEHLPNPGSDQELEDLLKTSYTEDLSVPREVASPLVNRMVQFHRESQELYRRHAGALDNAHDILAHDTDLRYGSLESATTTLLRMPPDKLPETALFTVRKALSHAGFAFSIDRRSHRWTGYLQIRSKQHVKNVNTVREWLREWQNDIAIRTAFKAEGKERALRRHRSSRPAQYVYDFIEKARHIILNSREDRDATLCGNIGPSRKRFSIRAGQNAIRQTAKTEFADEDAEIVKFIQTWCCAGMFSGLPRLLAWPPLILQATGMYEGHSLAVQTGYLFLQEIGTILPFENRVRFDQHLLLPSSQHSKPLQQLMSTILKMEKNHGFIDSMQDLRHDWGDLPVFCIDAASAHEIDDGISIERINANEYWVHVHIANPTAFFERDHALSKMARHMGESLYMPERSYMMLPRWATKRHFSLQPNRPCLTFSTRLTADAEVLERQIKPGFIRNVMPFTPDEIGQILDSNTAQDTNKGKGLTLTVGGEPPPPKVRQSSLKNLTPEQIEGLKMLKYFADKRGEYRQRAGGVFFDYNKPDVEVFQDLRYPGLDWNFPYYKGSRVTEGDPVIKLSTKRFSNCFRPEMATADNLVREMMLLACETGAAWCAERQIPAIYRGTVPGHAQFDVDKYFREILEPATKQTEDGVYPMHLGLIYFRNLGNTVLSTEPLKHKILGMDHYCKVTSPLRRYGDMILHWQVEAALREEARTGKSLVTQNKNADRSFLPFSRPVLDTIMLGLQPRENLTTDAKSYSIAFWTNMLMFRAFHFNETELPFGIPGKPFAQVYVQNLHQITPEYYTPLNMDLNMPCTMYRPDIFGLEQAQNGDVWECEIERVDVYWRSVLMKPVRLAHREEGIPELERWLRTNGREK